MSHIEESASPNIRKTESHIYVPRLPDYYDGVSLRELGQIRDGTTPRSVRLGWSYQDGDIRESKCEIDIADQVIAYDSKGMEGRWGFNNSKLVRCIVILVSIGLNMGRFPVEHIEKME